MVRLDGGEWNSLTGDQTRWMLRAGRNRLDARTRNVAGVDGPIVSLIVDCK